MAQSETRPLELSVVILNYNVQYFLNLCLESVVEATRNLDAEIIVVDNASNDGSVDMVRKKFPQVRCVVNNENTGFSKGNNIGVKHAKGKYICILNPDTVVSENSFESLLRFCNQNDNVGVVGPKLVDGSGMFLKECKRGAPTPWNAFTKITALYKLSKRWFGAYYNMKLDENTTGKTAAVVGAFMMLKKSIFNEIGGFDESFFMYFEDDDFCYRITQMGYQNYYVPTSTCIHFKGESTLRNKAFQLRFQAGINQFYQKHFPKTALFRFWLRLSSILFSLLKRFSSPPKAAADKNSSQAILVSRDTELGTSFQEKTKKEITLCSNLLHVLQLQDAPSQIFFDTKGLNYHDLINFMQTHRQEFAYVIITKDRSLAIGSDDPLSRGHVMELDYKASSTRTYLV
ncbi:MAG: glycosyltransferase family 2 protein [Flavobacteriaceae bacterium]|nr:glycosyltransferase family 2 protein [Flavobacteriaceae bacterium]